MGYCLLLIANIQASIVWGRCGFQRLVEQFSVSFSNVLLAGKLWKCPVTRRSLAAAGRGEAVAIPQLCKTLSYEDDATIKVGGTQLPPGAALLVIPGALPPPWRSPRATTPFHHPSTQPGTCFFRLFFHCLFWGCTADALWLNSWCVPGFLVVFSGLSRCQWLQSNSLVPSSPGLLMLWCSSHTSCAPGAFPALESGVRGRRSWEKQHKALQITICLEKALPWAAPHTPKDLWCHWTLNHWARAVMNPNVTHGVRRCDDVCLQCSERRFSVFPWLLCHPLPH